MTLSDEHSSIVDTLVARRKALGIGPVALARQIGTSHKHIWEWETKARAPNLGSLLRWSRALGLRVSLGTVPTAIKRRAA